MPSTRCPPDKHAALLTGSGDVSAVTIPDTGHALTFHRSQDQFQAQLSMWLTDHGFGGVAMPVGAADTGGGSAYAATQPALLCSGILCLVLAGAVLLPGDRRSRGHSPLGDSW